jgi:hypothetical protein
MMDLSTLFDAMSFFRSLSLSQWYELASVWNPKILAPANVLHVLI